VGDHEIHEEGLTRREALKRGAVFGGVALAWTTPLVQVVGMSPALAQTTSPVGQGCTPGYWKNSLGAWPSPPSPDDSLSLYFGDCAPSDTLLNALNYGGSGGMMDILLRAAVAALLNAMHPQVAYGMPESNIRSAVADALCSEDDHAMEQLKNTLDALNNAGCPLRRVRP
jgi:hypothetical protein